MTIKAIVLDLDGTLLTSKKEISPITKSALIAAQENGIKVVLASGRPTSGMIKYAEDLKLNHYEGYIISYNGAKVTDFKTKEVLFNHPIHEDTGRKVLSHLKQFDVVTMIDKDDYLYVNDVYDALLTLPERTVNIVEYESRLANFKLCEVDDLADFLTFPLNKILVAGDPNYLKENYKAMKEPFEEVTSSSFTAAFFYEFMDKHVEKSRSLDALFGPLGIRSDEVMIFGDGHNDRSLFEYAGLGIAMGNAVDEIKSIAKDTTSSNDKEGISEALLKYL